MIPKGSVWLCWKVTEVHRLWGSACLRRRHGEAPTLTPISAAHPELGAADVGSGQHRVDEPAISLPAGARVRLRNYRLQGTGGCYRAEWRRSHPLSTPVSDGPRKTHVRSTPRVAQPKENFMNWTDPREGVCRSNPAKEIDLLIKGDDGFQIK